MTAVILAAVGDMSLGDHLLALGFGVRSTIAKHGADHVFRHVAAELRAADVIFGNLECVISQAGRDRARPLTDTFRTGTHAVQTLASAGFNVVNVANNHSLQYGAEGFRDTLSALSVADIGAVGVRGDGEFLAEPVIRTVRGMSVGLLGYSQAAENFYEGEPLYARWQDEQVQADIRRLRDRVDFVVVSGHWGVEQIDYAPPDVMRSARAAIDAGADVVLGHHSHIFQSIESYGHGLICYSLGNFVFDTVWEKYSPISAIVRVKLEMQGDSKRIAHELVPVRSNSKYQPVPLTGVAKAKFLERLEVLTRVQQTIIDADAAELEKMAAERERRLHWRKIGHVLNRAHRVNADTWRVLVLDKLLRRLRPAPAGVGASSSSDG